MKFTGKSALTIRLLIILFFDILYVLMLSYAVGFVRYMHFHFRWIDCVVAAVLYGAFRFYHYKKNKNSEQVARKPLQVVLVWLYLLFLIAAPTALVWAKKTFPIQNPDLTIMTLQMPLDGFVMVFVKDFFERVGFYALVLSLSLLWPVYDLYKDLRFRKSVFFAVFLAILVAGSAPFWKAISSRAFHQYVDFFFKQSGEPYHSKFYKDEFIHYKPEMVTSEDTTRNLIFIYVESLENSFINFTPEIQALYDLGLVFSDKPDYGGGRNIVGASTTISSMVSKTIGMPLLCGSSVMNNFGQTGLSFFGEIPGLYDILHQFGYRNYYVQGTPARFGATGPFFMSHGMDAFYDKADVEKMLAAKGETYRRPGPGVADGDVLEYAKKILDTLSADHFSLTVTTIDMHYPKGFFDDRCEVKPKNQSVGANYAAVLLCTSRRIGNFVQWVQEQPFGKNTEIVVAGDHLFMARSPVSRMPMRDRRFLNIYINPKNTAKKMRRMFTSFDSAPTVLETMGFHIEGHRLGFGVSLLSGQRTLLETMGERELVHALRELSGSIEYNELFRNKRPSALDESR